MNIYDIVEERHSVRKYLDKLIEDDKIIILNNLIDKCNKDSDLHMQLVLDDAKVFDKFILHYGRIQNAKNYIAMIGKNDETLEERIGYNGEKIVLKAQELGLNTCWVAGTLSKKYISAEVKEDEKLICVIAIGYGENSGNKRKTRKFEDLSITTENIPEWYKKGIEFVLLAPSTLNQQKYKFELVGDKEVKVKTAKGHLTNVDLGIAKYHFELGAGIKNFYWQA